jgi:hypothetical protein
MIIRRFTEDAARSIGNASNTGKFTCRRPAFVVIALAVAACGGCGPTWYIDPGFAEKVAIEEKKPLLIYFKAWDSTQHRNMRMQVFSNSAVRAELKDTVNVELEFGFFPEHARRYGVQRPQVCVVCDSLGKRVASPLYVNPVPTPENFLEWLQRAKQEAMPAPDSPAKPPSTPDARR